MAGFFNPYIFQNNVFQVVIRPVGDIAPSASGGNPRAWRKHWDEVRRAEKAGRLKRSRAARDLDWMVREAYAIMTGQIQPPGQTEAIPQIIENDAIEAVLPFVNARNTAAIPPPAAIDWDAFTRNLDAIEALMGAYAEYLDPESAQDEDAVTLLMATLH